MSGCDIPQRLLQRFLIIFRVRLRVSIKVSTMPDKGSGVLEGAIRTWRLGNHTEGVNRW